MTQGTPLAGTAADGEREAWIALAATLGVGDAIFWALIARHGGAVAAIAAAASRTGDILPRVRIPTKTRDALAAISREPRRTHRQLEELGLWAVTPLEDGYPDRLRILDPPPPVLYGWGDVNALSTDRAVAVVGTRRPTLEGRALAARICTRLVEVGVVVISGLAIGIDGAAHAATTAAEGRTVAVIGGGHGQPGPRAHHRLLERILVTNGAVVSEHAPDIVPTRGTFPRRNRIISALGDATIVVEAPARSGALITARHALEQGRPVLVAPGRPGDVHIGGCLALLRETPARPLVGLDELVVDLGYDPDGQAAQEAATARASAQLSLEGALAMLGPAERAVARRLADGPAGPDALVAATGLTASVVSGAVTLLLMRGWVQAMGPAYLPSGPLLSR